MTAKATKAAKQARHPVTGRPMTRAEARFVLAADSRENQELGAILALASEMERRTGAFLAAHLTDTCRCHLCRWMRHDGSPADLRTDLTTMQMCVQAFSQLASCGRPSTSEEFWHTLVELAADDGERERLRAGFARYRARTSKQK